MIGMAGRVLASLALGVAAAGAEPAPQEPREPGRKQARAIRVADGAVRLDGRLDEAVWQDAPPVTDFTQKEPVEGAIATEFTDVRFLLDDSALYVGARMRSANPAAIQAPMGRRDVVDQAEYIQLSLDTYLDRRTAYSLGVTASAGPGVVLHSCATRSACQDEKQGEERREGCFEILHERAVGVASVELPVEPRRLRSFWSRRG